LRWLTLAERLARLPQIHFAALQRGAHARQSGQEKPMSQMEVITLSAESPAEASYDNHCLAIVNDHEVRISTMTEPYHWHAHPDSDETFLSLVGGIVIELEDRTIDLHPGQLINIPRGTRHRTRPIGARSVNLTFERKDIATTPALTILRDFY
jgi:mannose-6-phosphate isomerase-like protein (cupin superfamily)